MLTAQTMALMDDEHLLASARAEIDPLTSTPLEIELLGRFESLLDEQVEDEAMRALLEEYEPAADDLRAVMESHPASLTEKAALLSLLNDQDVYYPDQLAGLLDAITKFRALANDAGDFFIRLTDLVTPHQE